MADRNAQLKMLRKMAWTVLGLSFISCLARNDIDVVSGLVCVVLLNRFYDKGNGFTKGICAVLGGSLCVNVVTFIMYGTYAFGEGTKYWDDTKWVRVVAMVVSGVVVVVKGIMLFIILYKKV